jgi:hypothetical protein
VSDYEYDVFISYSRSGNVGAWVNNHLYDMLKSCLIDELGSDARIFLDREMNLGTVWPDEVRRALSRSRLMLAVLSPPYFQSRWCLAEFETMAAREQHAGLAVDGGTQGLILPLVFADGHSFPPSASNRQSWSVKDWGYPYPQFRHTPEYLSLHAQIRRLAEAVAKHRPTVPQWQADWPVLSAPHPVPPARALLPEL